MGFLFSLLGFAVAIMVLVFIHEYGHYKTALLCGVKVKRFSIGFGKPIFRHIDKKGVEWVVSWIPLGGYVLMLDGRNEEILPGEEHLSFDKKSLAQRFAIVAAGPLANLIFAVAAWAIVFSLGSEAPRAYLGTPTAQSIAAKAGFEGQDLLTHVGTSPVNSIEDAALLIAEAAIGGQNNVPMSVLRDGETKKLQLDLSHFNPASSGSDLLGGIGWSSPGPQRAPKVLQTKAESPAARAGFKSGDIIKSLNGKNVHTVSELSSQVALAAGKELTMVVEGLDKQSRTLLVTPVIPSTDATQRARIGVSFDSTLTAAEKAKYITTLKRGPWEATVASFKRCFAVLKMSLQAIGAMITGKSGSDGISGPVGIAQQAGGAASAGIVPFLSFLALLSLSLFLMNLLPIPALDGGRLVLFIIEGIRGKALPDKTEMAISQVGFSMLMALMVFAVVNDLSPYVSRFFG